MKKAKPEHRRDYWKYHVAAHSFEYARKVAHRIFAHHDKDSRITDADTGIDLFQLVVIVKGGEMRPGVQLVFPTDFHLRYKLGDEV